MTILTEDGSQGKPLAKTVKVLGGLPLALKFLSNVVTVLLNTNETIKTEAKHLVCEFHATPETN